MKKNKWFILAAIALCPLSLYWALTAPTQNAAVLLGFISGTNAMGALVLFIISIATDRLEKQRIELEAEMKDLTENSEKYVENFRNQLKDLIK